MNVIDIINKKRNKEELTLEELKYIIDHYVDGTIPDYQMSAFLMSICINEMTLDEVIKLTTLMRKSGEEIDLSEIEGIKVDKHSTGGVGDKITLILVPLVASCGVSMMKMSGRGLGYTGGTADKIESIPQLKVSLSKEEAIKQVKEIGACIVTQTGNLVPADKKIYALRDVTGTVESISLIAASIMSKKLACGADKIVLDIKVGNGALAKNIKEATKLAERMVQIGKQSGKETIAVLSNMNEPLGYAIGNALEVEEAIQTLKGNGPADVVTLTVKLASYLVSMAQNIPYHNAKVKVERNLKNGNAFKKFEEIIKAQGGDLSEFKINAKIFSIKSTKSGIVNRIDALKLAYLTQQIGAGRYTLNDEIDPNVGIVLSKKVGDIVTEGDELLKVYVTTKDAVIGDFLDCFEITDTFTNHDPLIYKVVK